MGFGICHRLLVQLSSGRPSDAQPYFKVEREKTQGLELPERSPDAGVTIVMACRDPKRAQDAREKLYRLLDKHIATLKKGTEDHAYAVAFRSSVRLDIERLDLSSVKSVLDFGKAVTQKYVCQSRSTFFAHSSAGTNTYHILYSMPAPQHTATSISWVSRTTCSSIQ